MATGLAKRGWAVACATLVGWGVQGCVLAPPGTAQEKERLAQHAQFEVPLARREVPPLPSPAMWEDVLRQAFLTNGQLESAYFEWKAALWRIDQAANWPNTDLMVGYSFMFSGGNMKGWDRSTFMLQPDPMANLQLPIKPAQAGKVALQDARAAGYRFLVMKFDLQRRVLNAYYDLALVEERLRIQKRNVELLDAVAQSVRARVQAGAPQQDLLKAQIEWRLAENELRNMQAERSSAAAMLNGLLSRTPEAPLDLPPALPAARAVAADDARLIAMGAAQNPELAALAAQVQGRSDALELARLRYIPDINPTLAFTGSISQAAGVAIMLPTQIPAIEAGIKESQAMLQASQAAGRQTGRDRAASFVAALYFMRNSEREVELYQGAILALAEQALSSSRASYIAGRSNYSELIESQRTLLNVQLMTAQARMEREKRLAELEMLAGTDVETLGRPTGAPASVPASQPAGDASGSITARKDESL
jgi:outer membrane protein, heavy metal efflux system